MLHYDMTCYDMNGNEEFWNTQPLSNVMNDECMKAYAYMLPRVICEGYVGLCHMKV